MNVYNQEEINRIEKARETNDRLEDSLKIKGKMA